MSSATRGGSPLTQGACARNGAVKETGQEALERGKQVAQETLATAKETAVESGTELGKNVADELKQTARDVAHTGSPNQH